MPCCCGLPSAVVGAGGAHRVGAAQRLCRPHPHLALRGRCLGDAARIGRARVPGGRRQHAGVHRGRHRARDDRRQDAGGVRRRGGRRRTADRPVRRAARALGRWPSSRSSSGCRCSSASVSCCSRRSCSRWRAVRRMPLLLARAAAGGRPLGLPRPGAAAPRARSPRSSASAPTWAGRSRGRSRSACQPRSSSDRRSGGWLGRRIDDRARCARGGAERRRRDRRRPGFGDHARSRSCCRSC